MKIEEEKLELSDAMIQAVVERLKALADESRVRILLRLKRGSASVNELAKTLGLAQPSVSKHLAVLKNVGLLEVQRHRTTAIYSIKDQTIYELCELVCSGVARFKKEEHQALGLE
ncbi:MAG: transcriptional regulator [Phycisphaerae bacterium]|jgi:DNA-binding transcriptional ArsR family regulator|nr:MAG: transcriptional regulator [Phycisphaerae bacterium]